MATGVDTAGKAVATRQARSRQIPPGHPKARVAEVGGACPISAHEQDLEYPAGRAKDPEITADLVLCEGE